MGEIGKKKIYDEEKFVNYRTGIPGDKVEEVNIFGVGSWRNKVELDRSKHG